jgi:ribosomal protein L11 methyltransferase
VPWQQLILRLKAEELPRTEALLRLAGAQAVSIADDSDFPLLEPGPGETPIWPTVILRALFPGNLDLRGLQMSLQATEVVSIVDQDWIDAWRQQITARDFGRGFWVTPADSPDEPGAVRQLRLRMGLAFGTGQHPTTALCLEWLTARDLSGVRVLDYGCGSGILALAALALGASYAWAVDDDSQAITATEENARDNKLHGSLWTGLPQHLPRIEADLIVANIVAGTLTNLASTLAGQARPNAVIALSGILAAQRGEVESAYAPFFNEFSHTTRDGWVCLSARRNPTDNR